MHRDQRSYNPSAERQHGYPHSSGHRSYGLSAESQHRYPHSSERWRSQERSARGGEGQAHSRSRSPRRDDSDHEYSPPASPEARRAMQVVRPGSCSCGGPGAAAAFTASTGPPPAPPRQGPPQQQPSAPTDAEALLRQTLREFLRDVRDHKEILCPCTLRGLNDLRRRSGQRNFTVMAEAFGWPTNPEEAGAVAPCRGKPCTGLKALQQHADKLGDAVTLIDDDDDDDDDGEAALIQRVHKILGDEARVITKVVAPSRKAPVQAQKFSEVVPYPPMLMVCGISRDKGGSKASLLATFQKYHPSIAAAMYLPHFRDKGVVGFSDQRREHYEAYEKAKLMLEHCKSAEDIGSVGWVQEEEYERFKSQGWAKDLCRWKAEHGVSWVDKAELERNIQSARKRRDEEQSRLSHQLMVQLEAGKADQARTEAELAREKLRNEELQRELEADREERKKENEEHHEKMKKLQTVEQMKQEEQRRMAEDKYRNLRERLKASEENNSVLKENASNAIKRKDQEIANMKGHEAGKLAAEREREEMKAQMQELERHMKNEHEALGKDLHIAKEEAEEQQSMVTTLMVENQQLKEVQTKVDKMLQQLIPPGSELEKKHIKIFGELNWQELQALGYTATREPKSEPDVEDFTREEILAVTTSWLQAKFWEDESNSNPEYFHPQRAFKRDTEGKWTIVREEDEVLPCHRPPWLPATFKLPPPKTISASWVKFIRKQYKKKADGILNYLLHKFDEYMNCGDKPADAVGRAFWVYSAEGDGRRMRPLERYSLLQELQGTMD